MREAQQNRSPEVRANMSKAQLFSQGVIVTDLVTGTKTTFHAIKAATRALNIERGSILNYIYLKQEMPVLDRYTFELVGDPVGRATAQPTSIEVEVLDLETDQKTVYPSVGVAARTLGFRQSSISLYLSEKRLSPFKGRYIINKSGSPEETTLVPVIEVSDLMDGGNKTTYPSITAAAKSVNMSRSSVSKYLGTNKAYKDRYLFNKIEIERDSPVV
jgi:tRNA threonylcarbamoyladenosine modification (KEOPS) complex  Pcc1 subunit